VSVTCPIITCPEWGAVEPRDGFESIVWTDDEAARFIIHHTAGHHREIAQPADESLLESIFYARDIQRFHMAPPPRGRGWNDSGHNFLVCRNGITLQGRWRTVRAIEAGRMVVSAHCPLQNNQIGIEFEHNGVEPMTAAQRNAGARLMAWCADQYGRSVVMPGRPHKDFLNTTCPANLVAEIPRLHSLAQQILSEEGDYL
jgi:N-acetylmuramoyl-L-alanine amidase